MCSLSRAQFCLDDLTGNKVFVLCTSFDALLRCLRENYIDTFNTFYLLKLAACFKKDILVNRVKEYEAEKETFLRDTDVLEFQNAVVSRLAPIQPSQTVLVTIKIGRIRATKDTKRTLKDIEELAKKGFSDDYSMSLIRFHVRRGSVVISWAFPETLSGKLEKVVEKNAIIFLQAEVAEVTIGGKIVFSSTFKVRI